jgi:indolepyruvate ferredoxin oxidoreductase beta subunit
MKKFDILLTGVGGEGVLTSQVILARAANLEGHFVRGVQLHGLAQRGGSIPTMVRFGDEKEISSPAIMQADADLILAFEPLEAVRAVRYARKEKTVFVVEEKPLVPIYAHLLDKPYPEIDEIKEKIKPFAKEIHAVPARETAKEKFGDDIFGNTILLGAAYRRGLIPLKKESIIEAIKISAPRETEKNLKAFEEGINES